MSTSLTSNAQIGDVILQPAVPAAEGEQALELYNPSQVGQGLDFYQRFADKDGAQQVLSTVAKGEVDKMTSNPTEIINYGNDVLEEVMAATKAIMEFTKDVKLPADDDAALRDLAVQLGKAGQYDMSVAANLEKYREMKAKLASFFGKNKAQSWFAAFQADRKTLEKLTDEMAGDFITRAKHRGLAANRTYQLFRANRESLGNLEERIAVLEKVREIVGERRSALPATLPPSDPQADEAAAMDSVLRLLDLKITNLANRWYTGMGLDPMLRAQQEQQVMMALKLQDIGTTGMEKVQLILAQYAMSLDLQKDADTVTAFEDFDNAMTQKMFKQTRATIGQVAQVTTRSGTTTETITTIANEVTGMLSDVQHVYADARANNAEQMRAIMAGVKVMESAQNKPIDTALVGTVVEQAKKSRSLLS
jgi:hypothetical protein